MGTNFYWADGEKEHIGKRSGAGPYCWDCRRTLCIGGEYEVHQMSGRGSFFKECPGCGKSLSGSVISSKAPPSGVLSSCSFIWAINPEKAVFHLGQHARELCVEDEYGKKYSGAEFMIMLESQCPIRFFDRIGKEFS